jgi:hypothetical protein
VQSDLPEIKGGILLSFAASNYIYSKKNGYNSADDESQAHIRGWLSF